jgi:CDP-diacylglycerol---glycerol-3-phosphate 3-phosphatidyltransferase
MDKSQEQLQHGSVLLQSEIRSWWVLKIMQPVENFCVRQELTPNMITMFALGFSFLCGVLFASGHFLSAGWLVMFAGSLDFLDGRVARATNQVTVQGAFFDSVSDRYQDFFMFAGLCVYYAHHTVMLAIVLLALGGSMLVSYVRSKAESVDVDLSHVGSMQRPERIFLIGFGSVISSVFQVSLMPFYGKGNRPPQHILILVLVFLAISSNWTAIRRISHTMKILGERKQ